MSLEARAIAAVLLMVAALAGWHRLTTYYEGRGYQRAQGEYQAAAELQREGNRGRARVAETTYAVQKQAREHFIDATAREVQHETDNLAACVLADRAVQLLNDTAACARGERATACGIDAAVRDAP